MRNMDTMKDIDMNINVSKIKVFVFHKMNNYRLQTSNEKLGQEDELVFLCKMFTEDEKNRWRIVNM